MKKTIVSLSIACAFASAAFADNPQWSTTFFNGIGSNPTLANMGATNGEWNFPAAGVAIENSKLVLDLDQDADVSFAITTKGEAKTAHNIFAKAVFTPVKLADLITGSDMNAKGAQIGFAVVKKDAAAYAYYAWVGGNDWVELDDCDDPDAETDLKIDIAYWTSTITAKFFVKAGDVYAQIGSDQTVTSTAAAAGQVASLSCTGSGSISAISGDYQYGVASIGEQKYPTAEDAMTAATSGQTVSLNRNLAGDTVQMPGSVTAKAGVKIDDNGYLASIVIPEDFPSDVKVEVTPTLAEITRQTGAGASGEYVIGSAINPEKVSVTLPTEIATYKQVKPNSYESIPGGGTSFVLETKDDLLPAGTTVSKMRLFLDSVSDLVEAYTKAQPASGEIKEALEITEGVNGLSLMMSYALGIGADQDLQPVSDPKEDELQDAIQLSVIPRPADWKNDDFTISYQYKKDGEAAQSLGDAPNIPLNLGSGVFEIIVVATPKAN